MITRIIITTRPTVDTEFYEFSLEFIAYRLEKYINTNKLAITTEYSDNGLQKTNTFTYSDIFALREYESDKQIQDEIAVRNQYNKANGITVRSRSVEKAPVSI